MACRGSGHARRDCLCTPCSDLQDVACVGLRTCQNGWWHLAYAVEGHAARVPKAGQSHCLALQLLLRHVNMGRHTWLEGAMSAGAC